MKKINNILKPIVFTSIIAFGSLYANDLSLEEIVKVYKSKDFKASYKGFNKYLISNPSNKRISFMYGRSAYEVGKYEDALIAFEKVLLDEPNNLRARLEIAQCYYALKKYDKAKEAYEKVVEGNIPEQVRDNINLRLASLKNDSKEHFFKAMLMAGISYDSNINNDADAGEYNLPLFGNITKDGEKESDSFAQIAASLNHKYKINNNIILENKGAVFTQRYFDYQEKDIDVITLGTGIGHYKKKTKLFLGMDYNNVRLDDHKYLDLYTLKTSVKTNLKDKLNYFGQIKFIDKNYTKDNEQNRDSDVYEIQNTLSHISKDYGLNTLSLSFGKELRQRGVRTDVANDYMDIKFSNRYGITKSLILDSSIDYKTTKYKYEDVNFLTKREDKKATLSLGFLKTLNKNITIGLNGSYLNNSSNHEPFEYDKFNIRSNLYYTF